MSSWWGPQTKPARHHLLVLDVGTSVVKALVVYLENNEVCIAGRGYANQLDGSMRGGMIIDLQAVALTCKKAIHEATVNFETPPVDLIFGVNGQLVEGVTTTIHYDRAHPDHPLEHSELKNIIYKIQQRSDEKLREVLSRKFVDHQPDIELIHAAVVEVQLDGYEVETPLGFQGKRLSLTVFNAYLPLVYASVIQNLARILDLNLISIAAQPYGLSKLLINSAANTDLDGVFLDIGDLATDVVIVKNGNVESMQSFSVGGRAVTRAIQKQSKATHLQAEKTKHSYAFGDLDKRSANKLSPIIEEELSIWKAGVELALKDFPATKTLPEDIYLTGGGSLLPEALSTLKDRKWSQDLSFRKKPSVRLIDSDDVGLVADELGLEWTAQDLPALGLAKLTLNLVPEDDVVATTLQSIVRSMRSK